VEEDDSNFYELFELERYCDITEENLRRLNRKYRDLALIHHPDHGGNVAAMQRLSLAKGILTKPDLKRRYDIELRKQYNEPDAYSTRRWWGRWIASGVMVVAGAGIIIAGIVAAPVTFGGSAAFGVTGGALLSAGISGSAAQLTDEDKSDREFLKDVGVGLLVGAAGGCIGAGAAVNIAKETTSLGAKVGIAALSGAGTGAAGHIISDTADLAITEGLLGEHNKENITNAKTRAQVFSGENAARFTANVLVGAAAGAAFQGVANKLNVGGAAAEIVDDTVSNFRKGLQICQQTGKRALPGLTGTTVRTALNGSVEVAAGTHNAITQDPNMSVGEAVIHALPNAGRRMAVEASTGITATAVTAVAGNFAPAQSDVGNIDDVKDDTQAPSGPLASVPEDSLEFELHSKFSYNQPSDARIAESGAVVERNPGNVKAQPSTSAEALRSNQVLSDFDSKASGSTELMANGLVSCGSSSGTFKKCCSDSGSSRCRSDARSSSESRSSGSSMTTSSSGGKSVRSDPADQTIPDRNRMKVVDKNGKRLYVARNRTHQNNQTLRGSDVKETLKHIADNQKGKTLLLTGTHGQRKDSTNPLSQRCGIDGDGATTLASSEFYWKDLDNISDTVPGTWGWWNPDKTHATRFGDDGQEIHVFHPDLFVDEVCPSTGAAARTPLQVGQALAAYVQREQFDNVIFAYCHGERGDLYQSFLASL